MNSNYIMVMSYGFNEKLAKCETLNIFILLLLFINTDNIFKEARSITLKQWKINENMQSQSSIPASNFPPL
jgi:hypothetical protein